MEVEHKIAKPWVQSVWDLLVYFLYLLHFKAIV